MAVYIIEGEKVTAHPKGPANLPERAIAIRSLKELKVSPLTGAQLVAIWNRLRGNKPIAKFKSRDVALQRLWAAFEKLAPEEQPKAPKAKAGTDRVSRAGSDSKQKKPTKPTEKEKGTMRADSKQAKVIELLRRPKGATIEELVEATGWQQHSVRGVLSGALKKRLGLMIESTKEPRGRVYRIIGAARGARA